MATVPAALLSALQGDNLQIATCTKITKTDDTVLGFTEHDVDIVYDGNTYYADKGYMPSNFVSTMGKSVDNVSINLISADGSGYISREDVINGVYEGATVETFLLWFSDVSKGIWYLAGTGYLGSQTIKDYSVEFEIISLVQLLRNQTGITIGPMCPWDVGVGNCGVDLSDFTFNGSVTAIGSNNKRVFEATLSGDGITEQEDLYFQYGLVTWASGNNNGASMEVRNQTFGSVGYTFELALPMASGIQVGDTFSVFAGCNKSQSHCQSKFDQWRDNLGFYLIPGKDKMTE